MNPRSAGVPSNSSGIPTVLTSTDRVVLRRWDAVDAEPLFALCADAQVSRYLGWQPTGVSDACELIDDFNGREHELGVTTWAIALRETDALIGWCGYARTNAPWLNPAVIEVGWMLGVQYWGRGFATEAALAALEIGAARIDRRRIISKCNVENVKSERVMERVGLVRAGIVHGQVRTLIYRAP